MKKIIASVIMFSSIFSISVNGSRCVLDSPSPENQTIEVNLMSPFLVPNNAMRWGHFSDESIELHSFVQSTLSYYGVLGDERKELEELCETIYHELGANIWKHPDDIPFWTYPIISSICKMCDKDYCADTVVGSLLGEKNT